jgi:hypothetical protein
MALRYLTAASAAACLMLAVPSVAFGQAAGTYSGTSADGGTISMTVSETSGKFAITGFSMSFTADCAHGGSVDNNFSAGTNFPITGGKADFADELFQSIYTFGNLHFVGTDAIKGTITTDDVTFAPGTPPKRAEFCAVPKQAFQLTKGGPESAPMHAPIVAVTRVMSKP